MRRAARRVAATLVVAAAIGTSGLGVASAGAAPNDLTCAQRLAEQLRAEFPTVGKIGADANPMSTLPEHVDGRALDVMIPDYLTPDQIRLGDDVVARVHALAAEGRYPVEYTTWRQQYAVPGEPAVPMEDRGSDTQNHLDHLHITVGQVKC